MVQKKNVISFQLSVFLTEKGLRHGSHIYQKQIFRRGSHFTKNAKKLVKSAAEEFLEMKCIPICENFEKKPSQISRFWGEKSYGYSGFTPHNSSTSFPLPRLQIMFSVMLFVSILTIDLLSRVYVLRGYCTSGPSFWRLFAFSQQIKQLWTKKPMDLVRNVPRNSKITVLLQ